jgi:hypothetical protein
MALAAQRLSKPGVRVTPAEREIETSLFTWCCDSVLDI